MICISPDKRLNTGEVHDQVMTELFEKKGILNEIVHLRGKNAYLEMKVKELQAKLEKKK